LKALKTVIRSAIVLLIFLFVGRWLVASWPQVRDSGVTFSWPWLGASVVVLAVYMVFGALLWHYLTRMLHTAIPPRLAMAAWFYSQLGKYAPGKVFLYLARLYFYAREGRAIGPVSLAVGLELGATVGASMLVVVAAIGALTLDGVGIEALGLAVALAAFFAMLHPLVLGGVVGVVSRVLRRPSFPVTVSYSQLLRLVGLHFANWLVFGAAFYAFIRSFHQLDAGAFLYVTGAFALSALAGMLAFVVPAGLGVREGLLALLLSRVMPEPLAVTGAVAARVWVTLVELAYVGVVSIAVRSRRPTGMELERLREAAMSS
jgi:hypothetical protein